MLTGTTGTTGYVPTSIPAIMNYSSPHGGDPNANMNSTATRIAVDPDTHQDFEPKSRSSDMPLHAAIAQVFTCGDEIQEYLY